MTVIRIIGKNGQFLVGKTAFDPTEEEINEFVKSTGIIPEEIKVTRSTK